MADFFWVGGTGNTSDNANHWALTSGGAPQVLGPTSIDNAIFDALSGTGTVTVDVALQCLAMTWTGSSGLNLTQAALLEVFGNLTFISGMTYTPAGFTLGLRGGAANITSATKQPFDVVVNATGAKTLQDNLTLTNDLTLTLNAMALNGKTVSVGRDCLQAGGTITGAASSVLTITRDYNATSGATSSLATVAVTIGRDFIQSGGTVSIVSQTGFFKVTRSFLKTAGSFTGGVGTMVEYIGNATDGQFRFNSSSSHTHKFNSAGGTGVWTMLAALTNPGTVQVSSGTFDTGGFDINSSVTGILTVDGGIFLATGSSVVSRLIYTRSSGTSTWGASTTFSCIGSAMTIPADAFNHLLITDAGASSTGVTLSGNTSCNNLTLTQDSFGASLTMGAFTLSIAGNVTIGAGTSLSGASGTLAFTGTGACAISSAITITVAVFKCEVPTKAFTITAATVFSVASLILKGSFSRPIVLQSASTPYAFGLTSANNNVHGASLSGFNNGGTQLLARASVNVGSNTGVKFVRQNPWLGNHRAPVGALATV